MKLRNVQVVGAHFLHHHGLSLWAAGEQEVEKKGAEWP